MSLCLPQGMACAFRSHDYNSVTPVEPQLRNGALKAHALQGDVNIPRQVYRKRRACLLLKKFRVRRPVDLILPKAYVLIKGSREAFSEAGY